MSKADQSLPRSLDLRTQRGPLMCLLVAVGVFMTLGGAVNAASVQEEARQFFERFVSAQNAHDLATVGSMLWNSEDFLWVTRGVQVRGSKTALNVFGSYYKGTWHLDPDTNQLQATALPDGTVQILVPVTFTRGEPGQAAQQATFLISQTIIRDPNGWHVATILPIADSHLKQRTFGQCGGLVSAGLPMKPDRRPELRATALGASRPLRFVSAKVPCLITQRTFSQRGGNGFSCPTADSP